MPARQYRSTVQAKTLSTGINNAVQSMTLGPDTLTLPNAYPYTMVIDPDLASEEVVTVISSPSTGTFTISRGQDGTSAQAHTASAVVKHMITPRDLQDAQNHIEAASGGYTTINDGADIGVTGPTIAKSLHGIASGEGSVVGTLKAQTLTNKTINLTNNTLTGTTAQFNTALSDADFATTALLEARVPVGAVNMWVTGTAPSGWLICDGTEQLISSYPTLSGVLGTTYGAQTNGSGGAGTTHFRLPDLRGRVPMGAGTGRNVANSANLTARAFDAATFSKVSDAETVALTIAQLAQHTHVQNSHEHLFRYQGSLKGGTDGYVYGDLSGGGSGSILINPTGFVGLANSVYTSAFFGAAPAVAEGTTATNQVTGSNEGHNNVQPSTLINFIIKY